MRTITTDTIIQNIKEMCIEANYSLTSDVKDKLYQAAEEENSPLGRQILSQLKENLQIAKDDEIPICQDTGMAVVFLRIGQDVHIEGQNLEDAVNEAIDSFIDEDKRPNINFNGTADEFREELNNLVVVLLSKNFEHEFIEFSEATGISRVQYEAFAAKFMAEANTDKH